MSESDVAARMMTLIREEFDKALMSYKDATGNPGDAPYTNIGFRIPAAGMDETELRERYASPAGQTLAWCAKSHGLTSDKSVLESAVIGDDLRVELKYGTRTWTPDLDHPGEGWWR